MGLCRVGNTFLLSLAILAHHALLMALSTTEHVFLLEGTSPNMTICMHVSHRSDQTIISLLTCISHSTSSYFIYHVKIAAILLTL